MKAGVGHSDQLQELEFEALDIAGVPTRCHRSGSGQPLLLIHTLRTQIEYFARIVPQLRERFEVHLLDLPGHGHSGAPATDYTADFFLGAVRAFAVQRNLKDFVAVGESIGGTLALALASELKTVARVVALNPFDYRGLGQIGRRSLFTWVGFTGLRVPVIGRAVSELTPRWLLRSVLRGGLYDPSRLPEELVDHLYDAGRRPGHARAFHSLCRAWNSWPELRSRVRNVGTPITLVQGDHDWAPHAIQETDARELAPRHLVHLKGCGHFSSLERPDEVVRAIAET